MRSSSRRFFRPGVETLERRHLLSHFAPVDLGDGLGPKFIGDGFTTVTEDFSDNPNHEDPATVPAGVDVSEAQGDRLFTHGPGPPTLLPGHVLDLPTSDNRSHILFAGRNVVREVEFRGIHPDFEVAAVGVDLIADGPAHVAFVGTNGTLVLVSDSPGRWGRVVATRASLLSSQLELGSIRSIRLVNGGTFQAAFDNITLLLAPRERNGPPTAFDDRATTPPLTPLVIDVLNNDFDPDADPLAPSLPTSVTLRGGQVEVLGQSILYTPPPGFPLPGDQTAESRTDRFNYVIHDDHGNSAAASVEVLVNTPPFQAPTVVVRARGAGSVSGILTAGSDADGDPLTLALVAGPARGQLLLDVADGSFEYRPDDPSDLVEDTFTYRVRDSFGAASDVATARLRVANRAPLAGGFSVAMAHGALGPLEGVLGSDPDGDALSIEFLPLDHDDNPQTPDVTGPQHGRMRLLPDGRFSYDQIPPDYIHWVSGELITRDLRLRGPERFRYRLRDHDFASQPAIMELAVPNAPPETEVITVETHVTRDRFRVPTDSISVSVPGVLWNDLDIDGDPLSAVLVDGPDHGALALRPDGSFTYVPQAGYTGPDGFRYRASDGFLESEITQVVLLVDAGASILADDFFSRQVAASADTATRVIYWGTDSVIQNDVLSTDPTIARRISGPLGLWKVDEFPWRIADVDIEGTTVASGMPFPPERTGEFVFDKPFLGTRYFAYAVEGRLDGGDGYLSNIALVTLHGLDGDLDGDGALDSEEGVLQSSLASDNPQLAIVPSPLDGRSLEVDISPFGTVPDGPAVLAHVEAVSTPGPVPPPAGVEFPVGFLEFEVRSLTPGEARQAKVKLPAGVRANTWWKFGREPADNPATPGINERTTSHWYEFRFDGVTGATFFTGNDNRTTVTLHLEDGQRGDDDLAVNGVIVDPGGPGVQALPRVASVVVNDGHAQRSMVTSLTVTFSSLVSVHKGAFELRRLGARRAIDLKVALSTSDGETVARLTFKNGRDVTAASLRDGTYRLTIRADKVKDASGGLLDGDEDGLAGGNYVDEFFRRFGDADGDGDVDLADKLAFQSTYGKRSRDAGYLAYFDYNGNRKVSREDRALFLQGFLRSSLGR
jgi:hypothetical protein